MAISVFHSGVVWVTDTHTEASPPRSPPHEADTVALEDSGGTIRRELDFQTRVRVLASTSIPKKRKKNETTEDVLSGR